MNPYLNAIISYPIVVILAVFSWYLVEKPCMQLKRKQLLHLNLEENRIIHKIDVIYSSILQKLTQCGWKSYMVLFVGVLLYVNIFFAVPSVITFPCDDDYMFLSGWLEQTATEDYRWVQQESSIELMVPKNATKLFVQGFVPDSFTEINSVAVSINNTFIAEYSLDPGGVLNIECDVSQMSLPEQETAVVQMVFNAQHVPSETEADQRIMSALISSIGFE